MKIRQNIKLNEAAYSAGYVVGTAVEIILAKGTGAALSASCKTKAGAELLDRIESTTPEDNLTVR